MKFYSSQIYNNIVKPLEKGFKLDSRTILFISSILVIFGICCQDIMNLIIVFFISVIICLMFRVSFKGKLIQRLFVLVIVLSIFQSLFYRDGNVLLSVYGVKILTEQGVLYSIRLIFRTCILLLSSMLIFSTDRSNLIAGFYKMKIPHELIFMLQISIRFLPIFAEELKTTLYSMQIRGLNLRKIYRPLVFKSFIMVILPVTYNALQKAEYLSITAETRGLRYGNNRTIFKNVEMSFYDWTCIAFTSVAALIFTVFVIL